MISGVTQEAISGEIPEETPEATLEAIQGATSGETCDETLGEEIHGETSEATRGVTLGATYVGVTPTVEELIRGVTQASRIFVVATTTAVAITMDEAT